MLNVCIMFFIKILNYDPIFRHHVFYGSYAKIIEFSKLSLYARLILSVYKN